MHSLKAIVVLCVYVAVCLMRKQTSGDNKSTKINANTYKAPPCGIVARTDGEISYVNKTVAGVGQFPWQAALFYKNTNTFVCSGVLVSAQLILTSILCLEDKDVTTSFDVRLGDWDLMTRASTEEFPHLTLGIKQAHYFPEKEPIIAALKLEKPVDFLAHSHILPICLPNLLEDKIKEQPKQGTGNHQCLVSGWGLKLLADTSDIGQPESHEMTKSVNKKTYEQIIAEIDAAVKSDDDNNSWKPLGFNVPVLTSDLEMHKYHHLLDSDTDAIAPKIGANSEGSTKSLNKIEENPTLVRKTKNPNPLDEFYEYADAEVFPRRKGSHDDKLGVLIENIKSLEKARRDTGYAITTTSDGGTVIMEDSAEISLTEARRRALNNYYNGKESYYGRSKKGSISPVTSSEALFLSKTHEIRPTRADEPEDTTLLKTIEVKIQDSCNILPQVVGVSGVKSCVVPINPIRVSDMCLVDWGTPVTCFETIKPKRPSHPKYKWTRAYLAGLVSWKQQCIGIQDVDGDPTTNTALIMNTTEMLEFIKKHIEK